MWTDFPGQKIEANIEVKPVFFLMASRAADSTGLKKKPDHWWLQKTKMVTTVMPN